jgi:hypothetical protein
MSIVLKDLFSETLPHVETLIKINSLGFKTDSSQPGHIDLDNPRNPEHSAPYGVGYCYGVCSEQIADLLRKTLSDRYRVQYENKITYKGSTKQYNTMPVMKLLSFNTNKIDAFKDIRLSSEVKKNFCCIAAVDYGPSTIFTDIANALT